MDIKPIHNELDYRAALKAVAPYFENEPDQNSDEGNFFEVMLALIAAYEAKAFPIDLPDPIEAIHFRIEQLGMSPKDLQPFIGRSNRVSEILNRKRSLTIHMIRKLNFNLGIPAECLLKPTLEETRLKIKPLVKKKKSSRLIAL
jgi:HTH-type transcriptional regulator/antitoxin HigA